MTGVVIEPARKSAGCRIRLWDEVDHDQVRWSCVVQGTPYGTTGQRTSRQTAGTCYPASYNWIYLESHAGIARDAAWGPVRFEMKSARGHVFEVVVLASL